MSARAAAAVMLAVLSASPGRALAQRPAPDTSLASMIAAELEFATQAREHGIPAAFRAYLSDSAIVFAPGPVNGQKHYARLGDTPARLGWYPSRAGVSRAGDLGFTFGPYEYRSHPDSTAQHGHFASVWRRQHDGVWKVELDLGSPHARPGAREPVFRPESAKPIRQRRASDDEPSADDLTALRGALMRLDTAFCRTAAATGTGEALDQFAAADIRLQRPGALPVAGRRRAVAAARRDTTRHTWAPLGAGISRSGDLGYTWGAVHAVAGDPATLRGYYLRIWSRQSAEGWRILLDVLTAPPS